MDKQQLREQIWDDLEESGEARFPFPPHERIPNFAGAEDAAERLAQESVWQKAETIKSNPDSPQLPVRRKAMRQGKMLYMAVPRLREAECFLRLNPREVADIDQATTIGGSSDVGVQVSPGEMEPIDVIVSGSVAVSEQGNRIGKGEGYSDLEYAILRECGLVDDETTVVTTVHELQVVSEEFPTEPHDVPIDVIITPDRRIATGSGVDKPRGIDWNRLSDAKINEIPILQELQAEETS